MLSGPGADYQRKATDRSRVTARGEGDKTRKTAEDGIFHLGRDPLA